MQATKQKKQNAVSAYFSVYFKDFGLRQIATILMLISAIIALIGVCIPHQVTLFVGLYVYAFACVLGIADAIRTMINIKYRKAPAFKRATVNLIITLITFTVAVVGIVVLHVNGLYA